LEAAMGLIEHLGFWNWFILGAILLGLEVMVPGTFILWLGLAAILVGLISLGIDWPWQAQLVTFAVLSVVAVVMWWRFGRHRQKAGTPGGFLNRRTEALVGRVFTLDKPIVDGSGTIRLNDTIWRVTGPDAPAGSRVKVARADGAILYVDRIEA
jgi:membrane protein implicated in regulation of membrane protease activity